MINDKLQNELDIATEIRKKNENKAYKKQQKEGTNRRMSEWREKKRKEGYKPYELWLKEEEIEVVKQMIEILRKNKKEAEAMKREAIDKSPRG
jgi:hypothetical protein